jgi:cation/acetate symporter
MSAASFLGIAGLVSLSGFDGLIYSTGWLVGWPLIVFLIAEPLRNLGKYTFADVVAFRLKAAPGAHRRGDRDAGDRVPVPDRADGGRRQPHQAHVRPPYEVAVVIVGCVMLLYVLFGGMLATTWVQIIKAVLLLGGALILAIMTLWTFGMNPLALFQAAVAKYPAQNVLAPGSSSPIPGTRSRSGWR